MGASNYYLAIIDLDAMSKILVHTAKLQLKMQITKEKKKKNVNLKNCSKCPVHRCFRPSPGGDGGIIYANSYIIKKLRSFSAYITFTFISHHPHPKQVLISSKSPS